MPGDGWLVMAFKKSQLENLFFRNILHYSFEMGGEIAQELK